MKLKYKHSKLLFPYKCLHGEDVRVHIVTSVYVFYFLLSWVLLVKMFRKNIDVKIMLGLFCYLID